MNTEERKAQFRAYYYRHHETNQAKARERSARVRAKLKETPEQAEERRRKIREWYAKNAEERRGWARAYAFKKRGDEPMPDVGAMTAQARHWFTALVIGLLAQRRRGRLALRRDWQHKRYGTKERKPKQIKAKRVLLTLVEKRRRRADYARRWRATHPAPARGYRPRAKREREPRPPRPLTLPTPKRVPLTQAQIRANGHASVKRWLAKMEATDPARYAAYRKRQTEKEMARRKANPQRRFACALRTKVYVAIRRQRAGKKSANTVTLIGCTIAELMQHIEKQFQPGMTWNNFGKGTGFWHADHMRPLASFNLTDPVQQREAFHWSNVSPRWSFDNISKGSVWNGRRWRHDDHACVSPAGA